MRFALVAALPSASSRTRQVPAVVIKLQLEPIKIPLASLAERLEAIWSDKCAPTLEQIETSLGGSNLRKLWGEMLEGPYIGVLPGGLGDK